MPTRLAGETTGLPRSKLNFMPFHWYGVQTLHGLTSRSSREHVATFNTYIIPLSLPVRSRSIHSRRNEDTKRNKQGNQTENDYEALLTEKTKHEENQRVYNCKALLEKSLSILGVWML